MKWSQLKHRIKQLISPELRDRLDFHVTRYHEAHDQEGEFWITIDKQTIFSGSYYQVLKTLSTNEELKEAYYSSPSQRSSVKIENITLEKVVNMGIHDMEDFSKSLFNYLNTPFEESLVSNNPLFKAFALIDSRLGKRRFEKIIIKDDTHKLIKHFYNLRASSFRFSEN